MSRCERKQRRIVLNLGHVREVLVRVKGHLVELRMKHTSLHKSA